MGHRTDSITPRRDGLFGALSGFLDCAGIGALVAVRNATVYEGRTMRVSHPQPIVVRMLDLTGLLSVMQAPSGPISRALEDLTAKARIGAAASTSPA